MIIEQSCLDWLTLSECTTETGRRALYQLAQKVGHRERQGRRIGYQGFMYGFDSMCKTLPKLHLFHGERIWKGRDWDLLVASGESAQGLIEHMFDMDESEFLGVRATRIDVQVTIPWPEQLFYLRHLVLARDISASVVHGISQDNDWSETLYIGSRSAPVMVRAYRKRVDDSGADWLRVEVEYKRSAAQELFWDILSDGKVGNWFGPVEKRCATLYDMIDPFLSSDPDTPKTHRVVGQTFKWLSTTVANCVCRLLADDDDHEAMVELVTQWYEYALSCQKRRLAV